MRLALAACLLASPALAYEDGFKVAMSLGNVIGSAEGCGLKISDAGVSAYINATVDPADISFPASLQSIVLIQKDYIADVSGAALAAHCEAVKRTASHYGLIE